MSPSRRRQAVRMLQDRLGLSERRACRYVGQHRSTQRHEPDVAPDDQALRAELRRISRRRPRWGYRRAHQLAGAAPISSGSRGCRPMSNTCCTDWGLVPTRPVHLEGYGRAVSGVLPYLPTGVDPAAIRMAAVCEALTESGDDFASAPRDSMFVTNLVAAFQSGGAEIASVEDLLDLGVYLTVAVKAPKVTPAIPTAVINEHARLLAAELDALPNVRVVALMGDVAIKAMNAVARQRRYRRVIPLGSTYKLRHGQYRYGDVRVLPSYLPTGKSYLIERTKRDMIAEDLRLALALMST